MLQYRGSSGQGPSGFVLVLSMYCAGLALGGDLLADFTTLPVVYEIVSFSFSSFCAGFFAFLPAFGSSPVSSTTAS